MSTDDVDSNTLADAPPISTEPCNDFLLEFKVKLLEIPNFDFNPRTRSQIAASAAPFYSKCEFDIVAMSRRSYRVLESSAVSAAATNMSVISVNENFCVVIYFGHSSMRR